MAIGSAPASAASFVAAVSRNPTIPALLDRLSASAVPGACLAGGCLFQTVWNLAHGFDPSHGIRDYDVFYFDDRDLSAAAEAAAAAGLSRVAAELGVQLDVRNQARVHLWYEAEFGAPSPAFRSAEDGIDHFLGTCCAFGLRRIGGVASPYAPFGYEDLFDLVVRPNPRRTISGEALRGAWEAKTLRWRASWPRLTVMPWPVARG